MILIKILSKMILFFLIISVNHNIANAEISRHKKFIENRTKILNKTKFPSSAIYISEIEILKMIELNLEIDKKIQSGESPLVTYTRYKENLGEYRISQMSLTKENQIKNSPYRPKTEEEIKKYNQLFSDTLDSPEIEKYINSVKNKLLLLSNSNSKYKIAIINSTYVNGWSHPNYKITITRGMLNTIFNEDELACFISHEIGHRELNHSGGSTQNKEVEADIYAISLCQSAGYEPYAFADLFDRLANLVEQQAVWRQKGDNGSHPLLKKRAFIIRNYLRQRGYIDSQQRNDQRYQNSLTKLHKLANFMEDAVRVRKPLWNQIRSNERIEGPDFLGPESEATLERINNRLTSNGLLEDLIIMAPLIDLFISGPRLSISSDNGLSGYPLEAQIEALKGIPNMAIEITQNEIDLLLIDHTNDLTIEENDYWTDIYDITLDIK
ncbi:MAG TPA: hypothetical protein DDX98_06400 [Bacteroidales bacterium]|jgi:hypothetical protein|nr:hypothetical protein [Bacteroidales bacterium]